MPPHIIRTYPWDGCVLAVSYVCMCDWQFRSAAWLGSPVTLPVNDLSQSWRADAAPQQTMTGGIPADTSVWWQLNFITSPFFSKVIIILRSLPQKYWTTSGCSCSSLSLASFSCSHVLMFSWTFLRRLSKCLLIALHCLVYFWSRRALMDSSKSWTGDWVSVLSTAAGAQRAVCLSSWAERLMIHPRGRVSDFSYCHSLF